MTIELGTPIEAPLQLLEPQIESARRVGATLLARRNGHNVDLSAVIPAFHDWIQREELSDQLKIDVVDYRHLPQGPAVMLVCHEGHYAVTTTGGALGISYRAKRREPATLSGRLESSALRALRAAEILHEQGVGRLAFRGDRLLLEIADRLHAPNTIETFEAARDGLQRLADRLYPGQEVTMERGSDDARAPFRVELRAAIDVPLCELRARLEPRA